MSRFSKISIVSKKLPIIKLETVLEIYLENFQLNDGKFQKWFCVFEHIPDDIFKETP
jgi:hypothetical protein